MFVLRTAREIAAELLGLEGVAVAPGTGLGAAAPELLDRLLAELVRSLSGGQGIELEWEGNGRADALLARLGLRATSPTEVGGAAALATRAAVRALVANRLDIPAEDLTPELSFAVDLGADSLTRVDLVLLLEEALDVSVPDDSLALVRTVGDAELYAVLYDRIREAVAVEHGVAPSELAYSKPLPGRGALRAAADAAGIALPERPCSTLQEAARLAFLARALRSAVAAEAGADPAEVGGETRVAEDLGLSLGQMRDAVTRLARAVDIALPRDLDDDRLHTLAAAIDALTGPPRASEDGGGHE